MIFFLQEGLYCLDNNKKNIKIHQNDHSNEYWMKMYNIIHYYSKRTKKLILYNTFAFISTFVKFAQALHFKLLKYLDASFYIQYTCNFYSYLKEQYLSVFLLISVFQNRPILCKMNQLMLYIYISMDREIYAGCFRPG